MKSVPLTAFARALTGRLGVKKLRDRGRVPAVIYGRGTEGQKLEVDARDLGNLMQDSVSENLLVDLAVSDDPRPKRLVLLQEVQHHPLKGNVLHVDFHEVAEDETVTLTVPIETVGESVGVKSAGGVLEHVLFKIRVRALPKDLPEFIAIDVSDLQVGQSVHLKDVPRPEGVEVLGDENIPVVSVALPRTEVQETAVAEAGAGAGGVEVIKEKKEEGAAPDAKK